MIVTLKAEIAKNHFKYMVIRQMPSLKTMFGKALTVVDNDNSLGPNNNKRILLFDCLYNYQIIRSAAVDVRSREEWMDDENIQQHQFSDKWIFNFLKRQQFVRRKITTYR